MCISSTVLHMYKSVNSLDLNTQIADLSETSGDMWKALIKTINVIDGNKFSPMM